MEAIWCRRVSHRSLFDELGKKLQLERYEDWYGISREIVLAEAGRLLNKYGGSTFMALKSVYPEHEWNIAKFSHNPLGHWAPSWNKREFMQLLGQNLGYEQLKDYYQLTKLLICKNGGKDLLESYNGSIYFILKDSFPEFEWKSWKFKAAKGYWNDFNNVKKSLDHVAKEANN
jgi:hypothetical protein